MPEGELSYEGEYPGSPNMNQRSPNDIFASNSSFDAQKADQIGPVGG